MAKKIKQQIFLSYAWANSAFADVIDDDFKKIGITFQRDIRDIKFAESIKEFMQKIGRSDFVVMLISDEYIKSENCMYEVNEFLISFEYEKRILPVILPSAKDIFKSETHLTYYKFWAEKKKSARAIFNSHKNEKTIEDRKKITSICGNLGFFFQKISDLKSEQFSTLKSLNYEPILDKIGLSSKLAIDMQNTVDKPISIKDWADELNQITNIFRGAARMPLANILGLIELLKLGTLQEDETTELFEGLFSSATRLDQVIRNIGYVLNEKGKIANRKEVVVFDTLLDEVTLEIKNLMPEHKFQIICDFTNVKSIVCIKDYMRTVFINLIISSIQHKNIHLIPR